jgi:4-aminobutyrate aminotransferase-like enzyme
MDKAWPESGGEAIHTSTFLGHPVGCAMALAHLSELKRLDLVAESAGKGRFLLKALSRARLPDTCRTRGLGLMAGVELLRPDGSPATETAVGCVTRMLHKGVVALPEGEHSNVVSFTPPLTITRAQLQRAILVFEEALSEMETR